MSGRWSVLGLLFGVRTVMAFQFQSVAALSPLILRDFGISLGGLGLFIGLYLAPGIALALPGAAIGRRYGEKRMVLIGLALMIAGGALMAAALQSWNAQLLGRLLSGTGGVLLNVIMSKMVTDWFSGYEIATAMGIFVNSWPFGIALALLTLPAIGVAFTLSGAFLFVAALAALAFIALAIFYRGPPAQDASTISKVAPSVKVLEAVAVAGAMWGLLNASIGMIFGFAPALLAERGWNVIEASSATSIVLFLTVVSVPLGGYLADRSGRRNAIIFFGCAAFGAVLLLASSAKAVVPVFILLGLIGGLPAGPIMSLPSYVLASPDRAIGMGLFFTLFYLIVVIAPLAAGSIAASFGSSSVAFDAGAVMLALCCLCLFIFQRMANAIAIPVDSKWLDRTRSRK
ncbi:MAG: MFS transporter [Rhodomicrobium sp.]